MTPNFWIQTVPYFQGVLTRMSCHKNLNHAVMRLAAMQYQCNDDGNHRADTQASFCTHMDIIPKTFPYYIPHPLVILYTSNPTHGSITVFSIVDCSIEISALSQPTGHIGKHFSHIFDRSQLFFYCLIFFSLSFLYFLSVHNLHSYMDWFCWDIISFVCSV